RAIPGQPGTLDLSTHDLYGSQRAGRADNRTSSSDNGNSQQTQFRHDSASYAKYINRNGIEVDDGADDYRGTYIPREISGGKYYIGAGDTLISIARRHLGEGATRHEIQNHAQEIARMNHLTDNAVLRSGQRLILPGHTADGGFTFYDGRS